MKIKHLLTLLLTMATLPALAQGSGIKGKVVSRGDRAAIEQVKITLTPGERQATSDAEGRFRFDDVASGDYTLTFEADDYEPLEIKVRVDKLTKDVRSIALVPVYTEAFDDSIFAEFDTETANDTQSLPSSLSSSKDVFNNIASYKFGEMRFNLRGYDSQYTNVYFNGIRLNDALTGYTPWSLWSGLNDATRNQENTTGLQAADYGLGGIGGTTNINATASQIRKGLRVSLVNGNSMYRFRAMVSYASGLLDNGWSYAFSVSTRQGGNDWVNGIYYNCFGYYGSVEKRFNERNRLTFTILGAPTERGAQQASTQEVYDLVGNNYYNPNWGYQDGKKRNARVRNNHEPLTTARRSTQRPRSASVRTATRPSRGRAVPTRVPTTTATCPATTWPTTSSRMRPRSPSCGVRATTPVRSTGTGSTTPTTAARSTKGPTAPDTARTT